MTIQDAAKKFKVNGLKISALKNQGEAFQNCLSFLSGVEKIQRQNRNYTSYGLKHIVENPSGRFGTPSSHDFYTGYIYEGTFILAALTAGFTMHQYSQTSLFASFNVSEQGIRRRVMEIAKPSSRITKLSFLRN